MLPRFKALLVLVGLLAFATPAQADWWEASTDHFVIYADDREKDVREFAESLERYHSALEVVMARTSEKPSPSNRVTIFVVGKQKDIRRLAGTDSRTLRGFYVPRAGASRAFVEDIALSRGELSPSMRILLHEYAHHYLMSSARYSMPRWFNEGAAEFLSSARFERDGGVSLGRPAYHRGGELAYAQDVSVEELLDADLYARNKSDRYDAFYGRSWLLYHYLALSGERSGQLVAYVTQVANGTPSIEAGRAVFGDLDVLQDELDDYKNSRRMVYLPLPAERIATGPVALSQLPEGEAEMMDVRIRSQRGVNAQQAAELLEEAREIAARYPDDPGVLTALAEAEHDARNDDAAIAAADRAIALDPNRKNAYVQKGLSLFRKAGEAENRDAAFREAMKPFSALNALETDHPFPLIFFYRSYLERGATPTENAKHALERASQLAPFDHGLAMNVGMMLAREGKISLARATLGPVATNPHGGRMAQTAASFRDAMADAEEGVPWYPGRGAQSSDFDDDADDGAGSGDD